MKAMAHDYGCTIEWCLRRSDLEDFHTEVPNAVKSSVESRKGFRPYIDRMLVPTLRSGDIVKEHNRNKRNKRNNWRQEGRRGVW